MTARLLAERGHDVIVLEEHREVGVPVHCTGLLGLDAFDEFALPRETVLSVVSAARFRAADGTSVVVRSDRVKAAVIDRALFDQAMIRRAVAAGADLRRGWRADRIAVEGQRVVISAHGESRPVEARACVLACGANYRFHRRLGLGVPTAHLQSAQIDMPFPEWPHIDVQLGREVAPKGFAWLVPFRRGDQPHARIGSICATHAPEHFAAFARGLCATQGVDPRTLPRPHVRMLPLGPVSKTYATRVVAVGDAAGLVKPTTGGGIYYGLLSGAIAAGVLDGALRNDRFDESELRRYEVKWRRRLGAEIRVGLAFRHLAERLDDRAVNSIIELARVNGVVPLLQETASFNWHRKAAVALLGHAAFRNIVLRSLST